jgi:hypothetical protein
MKLLLLLIPSLVLALSFDDKLKLNIAGMKSVTYTLSNGYDSDIIITEPYNKIYLKFYTETREFLLCSGKCYNITEEEYSLLRFNMEGH